MNVQDRMGSQDSDAALMFAAARAYRPSTRARHRTMKAFGLPIGLSLFGSSVGQVAYAVSSVKGWVMVVGVVATVGATGGVAYVVTAPPPAAGIASRQVLLRRGGAETYPPRATQAMENTGAQVSEPTEAPHAAKDEAPIIAAAAPTTIGGSPSPTSVVRESTKARPKLFANDARADSGVSSVVPSPTFASEQRVPIRKLAAASLPPPTAASWSLKVELALVAEAQARLRVGDSTGAMAALDRHARMFPDGALCEETDLLRMRAFVAAGDLPSARSLGDSFLRRHPASPLAARVRALTGSPNTPRQGESR